MRNLALVARNMFGTVRKDESGQDAFEYLLTIGVIMVAVVGAVALGVWTPLVTAVVAAVQAAVVGAI